MLKGLLQGEGGLPGFEAVSLLKKELMLPVPLTALEASCREYLTGK